MEEQRLRRRGSCGGESAFTSTCYWTYVYLTWLTWQWHFNKDCLKAKQCSGQSSSSLDQSGEWRCREKYQTRQKSGERVCQRQDGNIVLPLFVCLFVCKRHYHLTWNHTEWVREEHVKFVAHGVESVLSSLPHSTCPECPWARYWAPNHTWQLC